MKIPKSSTETINHMLSFLTYCVYVRVVDRYPALPSVKRPLFPSERTYTMATNLLDPLKGLITPDLLSKAAGMLGVSEGATSKALGAVFPTVLSGLLNKTQDAGAMGKIFGLLTDKANDGSIRKSGRQDYVVQFRSSRVPNGIRKPGPTIPGATDEHR